MALGRVWQLPPGATPDASPEATSAREKAIATLLQYANAPQVDVRKAAVGAFGFLGRQDASRRAIPALIEKLNDTNENFDVRLVAATVLGPIGSPSDQDVIEALNAAMRDTDPRNSELVWGSALSLAQLDQSHVADTILMLLDRKELAQLNYYDRETDPQNPTFRRLSDQEQQRFLINTMLGAKDLNVPAVQARLQALSNDDPSARVRAAATEVLGTQSLSE
ncbi:MAG: HEAT repeat domain-containing protein [Chthoniobacterales bacterium]|nr:HEAT repeat domain-containing protein [Chthoniobacterales bacterium]